MANAKSEMTGFLTYLPTLAFVPHEAFALTFLFVLIRYQKDIIALFADFAKIKRSFILLSAIAVLSIINFFVGYFFFETELDFPYPVLILATYIIAMVINRKDLEVIFWLSVFEGFVVIAEFASGTNSFIPEYARMGSIDTDLLYFSRPMGLSYNSSIVAYKLLIAILIAEHLKRTGWMYRLAQVVLFTGIVLTFSRTIIVVLLIYFALSYATRYIAGISELLQLKIKIKNFLFLFIFTGFLAAGIYLAVVNMGTISNQFTRGRGNIEFSGREMIWPQFIGFIQEHPFAGNHSVKFYADYHGVPDAAHAHNSFLQILADQGIFIFALYMLFIAMNINKRNIFIVIAFIIYSITQYGIFWGISLIDIVFIAFLLRSSQLIPTIENNAKPLSI